MADTSGTDHFPQHTADTEENGTLSLPLLEEGCRELGIPLTAHQIVQFELYYRELLRWNKKFNLTAITGHDDVQTKHFLDSLAALPAITEQLNEPMPPERRLHLVDVGTGAGFPGVPLKIAAPRLKLTLMDGTGKKIRFLESLVSTLGLDNVYVVQGRAEELGRTSAHRGQYDLVTARAVAPLNTLAEYLLPLVRREGYAVVYKGPSATEEFVDARQAIELLGGETARIAPVQVPFLEESRFIVLIKKVRRTPDTYPRGQGLARRNPLS
jgi:16S rRNA (guanine527-N7)-methyltransferase